MTGTRRRYFYGYTPLVCGLTLPFTHKSCQTHSLISQGEPEAHELKFSISLPDQLMPGRRIVGASEVSADLRNQSNRVTQQHGWFQSFFLA
jgi:hypothetical protein